MTTQTDNYKVLFDYAPTGFFRVSENGLILEPNIAGALMLKQDIQMLKNKPLAFYISDSSLSEYYSFLNKLENESKTAGCEIELKNSINEQISVLLLGNKIKPTGDYILALADNTGQKKKEYECKLQEQKYKTLFDNMTNGFSLMQVLVDENETPLDIKILEINNIGAKYHNHERTAVVNKTIKEITGFFNPIEHTNTIQVALTGKPVTIEKFCPITGIFLNVNIFSPEKYYAVAISEDITTTKQIEESLKQNETQLQELLNSITDYIYKVIINEGKVTETIHSESCLAVTGYTAEEFKKNNLLWFAIVHDDDKEHVKKTIGLVLEKQAQKSFEHRIVHKNGSTRWIRNTILLHTNTEGLVTGYDGLIIDITQIKTLEQNLLKSVIDAEERERLNFSQELHDGLGPLLSSVKILSQMLKKDGQQKDKEALFSDIEMLIDESLMTIREISSKLSPHILKNYGIKEALNSFITKVKETSFINISTNIDEMGRFDERVEIIVYRAICECINNTLKHANANNVSISIYYLNNILFVLYNDDGIGFNVDEVLNANKGIGLLNIRSRIQSMNGKIDLISKPGLGTIVKFQIRVS